MRQRIRTIKPEFFRDQKVTRMTPLARLLLIGLFTLSDDEGRLNGDPRSIRSAIFPTDTITAAQVAKLLGEITDQSMIVQYTADGYEWIQIVKWNEHQRINRPSLSTIPPCAFTEQSLITQDLARGPAQARIGSDRNGAGEVHPQRTSPSSVSPPAEEGRL